MSIPHTSQEKMMDKPEDTNVFELFYLDRSDSDINNILECCSSSSSFDAKILKNCMITTKTVILEHEYIDKDYRSVYSGYYSKKFTRSSSRTLRLHLFDVIIGLEVFYGNSGLPDPIKQLEQAVRDQEVNTQHKNTTDGYIGYVVIRPTEYSIIGRCLLDPRKLIDFKSSHAVGCLAHYTADIMGVKLHVSAFPHQSQDAEVHICAHTAIWSLFRYLSQRYPHYPEQYPYDIALLNKDLHYGRLIPGRGLYMEQVTAMFGQFGLAAEMYYEQLMPGILPREDKGWADIQPITDKQGHSLNRKKLNKDDLLHLLHCHVDSGMPPVVGIPGHAIVALGVAYEKAPQVTRPGTTIPSTDFLSGVIVNDDNSSPYRIAYRATNSKNASNADYCCDDIDSMVVPLPNKVFLSAEKAEFLITDLANNLGKPAPLSDSWSNEVPMDKERFVRRLYCTSSRNYKESRRKNCDAFGAKLLELPLPHFLWIAEFTPFSLWDESGSNTVAEIAIDATSGPYDDEPYVWIRYPNELFLNMPRLFGILANDFETITYTTDNMDNLTFSSCHDNLRRFT